MKELLNIVNEEDEIIGTESRERIHQEGLLHREIHVYFITPKKELIFQCRAKNKDTFPGLLDATVGGHVELGDSYEKTAIKETEEETRVKINSEDLILIKKNKGYDKDSVTGKINYAFQNRYLYVFKGQSEDLKVEEGKALGFEFWPLEKLSSLDETEKKKFIPGILSFAINELTEFIKNFNL